MTGYGHDPERGERCFATGSGHALPLYSPQPPVEAKKPGSQPAAQRERRGQATVAWQLRSAQAQPPLCLWYDALLLAAAICCSGCWLAHQKR